MDKLELEMQVVYLNINIKSELVSLKASRWVSSIYPRVLSTVQSQTTMPVLILELKVLTKDGVQEQSNDKWRKSTLLGRP